MRRSILLVGVLFLLVGTGPVLAGPVITNFSRVETAFLRDAGITSYHLPVFKTTFSVAWESGWSADLSHSTGFGQCFEKQACAGVQEWDFELSYNRQIGNWRLLGQASYFALGEIGRGEGDIIQGRGRMLYTALFDGRVRPYVELKYQHLIGTGGGLGLTHLGADFSWQVAPRWSIAGSADLTYDSAPFREHGWLARGDVGVWWDWTPMTKLGAWVKARTPITDFESERRGVAGGIGVKTTWK